MIEDIFVPKENSTIALVEQLHTVTYITSDKVTLELALVHGYGLKSSGWKTPSKSDREACNDYFGLKGDAWEFCSFYQTGGGANIQVRAFYTPEESTLVRETYDGLIVGGATISFPKADLYAHEKTMTALGFKSTIGVKEMEFTDPSGVSYISAEIIYYAPDNAYLLAVKRPDIFIPVGPTDPDTGIGGPAYSARCIANSDGVIEFLKNVLGYEIRRDVIFPIGERSAMLLPEGSRERFIQAFAPGSSTGYLVLMDHMEDNKPSSAPTLGPPSRGITMWSFETKDIDEVSRRAKSYNVEHVEVSAEFQSPFLNSNRTLVLKDPDGFHIEIFERLNR